MAGRPRPDPERLAADAAARRRRIEARRRASGSDLFGAELLSRKAELKAEAEREEHEKRLAAVRAAKESCMRLRGGRESLTREELDRVFEGGEW